MPVVYDKRNYLWKNPKSPEKDFGGTYLAKILIWLSRILAFIPTIAIGYAIIFRMTHGFLPRHFDTEPILMTAVVIIGVAGIILSWKKRAMSGALFIINALVIGIGIWVLVHDSFWSMNLIAWSMWGLPFLVSGILEFVPSTTDQKARCL